MDLHHRVKAARRLLDVVERFLRRKAAIGELRRAAKDVREALGD